MSGRSAPGISCRLARAAGDRRIGVVAPTDYTLILARAALIPKRAEHPELARQFIDFALSEEGRRLLTESGLIVPFDGAAQSGLVATGDGAAATSCLGRPRDFEPRPPPLINARWTSPRRIASRPCF